MTSTTVARNGFLRIADRDPAAYRNGAIAEAPVERVHAEWVQTPAAVKEEAPHDDRRALAVFCHEAPDGFIGQYVSQVVAAVVRRGTPVHVFARHEFAFNSAGVQVHAVGECDGDDLLEQAQEFTHRVTNAFLHEFPNGASVTLMGFEWPTVPALSLLHGIKDAPALLSLHSLEAQRSDLTSEISHEIEAIERAGLYEARTIWTHDAATAEAAILSVPDAAERIVAARQPFPVASFETELDPSEVKARFQIGPVDPTIVCVGDLSEPYGQNLLVKAMPAVLKNHPGARLVVVGEGDLYWPLRVYARYLLLEHAVRLPGSVEGQALAELVAAADVVCVPSRAQTPWWPVLAGWAAGRPVVATHAAAPGLMEHEQTGVLCYASENSLVWGVERVLFDADLRAGMAEKGRDKLEEGFGWNRVAEQVQELMGATARP